MAATAMKNMPGSGTTFRTVVEQKWRKACDGFDVGVKNLDLYFNKFFTQEKTPVTIGGVLTLLSYVGRNRQTKYPKQQILSLEDSAPVHKAYDAIEARLDRLSKDIDTFEESAIKRMNELQIKMAKDEVRIIDLCRG